MRNYLIIITALIFISPCRAQEISNEDLMKAMHSISSHDLLEYVQIQCDEKYRGRLTGTKEYQECAEWLVGELEKWGVSLRQVQRLLADNRVPGAKKHGRSWMVPDDAEKPVDAVLAKPFGIVELRDTIARLVG